MTTENISGNARKRSLAGKYLTFSLSKEHYGVEILKVVEIIGLLHVTRVPQCPTYMKGVINLRGKIIPVLDLRMKFGLEAAEYDDRTCTIIVKVAVGESHIAIGMIVDTVLEVVEFPQNMIEPPPDFGASLDTNFIMGMGKASGENVIILIDIDKVLNSGDGKFLSSLNKPETQEIAAGD